MASDGSAPATPTPSDKPRLTSLEYLQLTQRSGRGSITDPSLHVSHPMSPKRRSPARKRERDEDEPGPLRPSQTLDFNYAMRRHSIAAVPRMRAPRDLSPLARSPDHVPFLPPPAVSGQKRKLPDRPFPAPPAPDDRLDGPALKRRGSALYDRRDSAPWLDRRDSTASLYSTVSSVGYTTANSYSSDTQLHNGTKPGQVYAWPDADPPPDVPQRSFPSFSETHSNGTAPNGERRASASSGSDAPRHTSHDPTPEAQPADPTPRRDSVSGNPKDTPYSRSPELRVSHKLAERKRRKEMKDLFDELRDHLPADRGMKASKWEILSKAVDYISQLKQSYAEVSQELDMTRHELEALRPGSLHHPTAPHHPHPHPGYALPYATYPVSHYPVQPGAPLPGPPPPPTGSQPPPPTA